jgi:hypothetical protein
LALARILRAREAPAAPAADAAKAEILRFGLLSAAMTSGASAAVADRTKVE